MLQPAYSQEMMSAKSYLISKINFTNYANSSIWSKCLFQQIDNQLTKVMIHSSLVQD